MTTEIHPADASQARAITHGREARESTIREINEGYARFVSAGDDMANVIIRQANEARAVGLHLFALKASSKRDFGKLFATSHGIANANPALHFSHEHGNTFMRFAALHPEPIADLPDAVHSLKDLMIAAGALPESSRGQQQSHGSLNWLTSLQKQLMSAQAIIGKQFEKAGDMRQWTRAEVQAAEAHLRPFAEQHRKALAVLGGAS